MWRVKVQECLLSKQFYVTSEKEEKLIISPNKKLICN